MARQRPKVSLKEVAFFNRTTENIFGLTWFDQRVACRGPRGRMGSSPKGQVNNKIPARAEAPVESRSVK
jgi:hypothetical protein